MKINSQFRSLLSDLTTPVSLFLKVRENYPEVLLLESSDYSSKEDSLSFLCFDSLARITIHQGETKISGALSSFPYSGNAVKDIETFISAFDISCPKEVEKYNGIFGYCTFDAVQYFEKIAFDDQKPEYGIPDIRYDFYRFIIVFDHYYERLTVIENIPQGSPSQIDDIINLVYKQDHHTYSFSLNGAQKENMTDRQFMEMVTKAKSHCQRGDVFQMVPARRYSQPFLGDEFNVYRALRAINPSPYLFYFDYSRYKIFGSSPEAQMIVKNRVAEIHPIAGTFRRTGDPQADMELARQLLVDPKENAEHIMLVDLARNDLSKNTTDVSVFKYKEVQYFSHVIHLVSIVKGKLKKGISAFQVFADTFPAGTLSGAPKYKAMQLIDSFEPTSRGYYGGGLGMIGFNGDLNHAIMIRSFLSMDNLLHYQAGAGIVIDSEEEKELQEVQNKLDALKNALKRATEI